MSTLFRASSNDRRGHTSHGATYLRIRNDGPMFVADSDSFGYFRRSPSSVWADETSLKGGMIQ
jgi:hypothetical protein